MGNPARGGEEFMAERRLIASARLRRPRLAVSPIRPAMRAARSVEMK